MSSTYRSELLRNLNEMLMPYTFRVLSTSETIQSGDLVELNYTTGYIQLLEDDAITDNHKFIGISDGYWDSTMNDATIRNELPVLGFCLVEAPLVSATYQFGEALMYDAGNDDGRLISWDGSSSNQIIGWYWESNPDTVDVAQTSGKVLINTLEAVCNMLETSSP